MTQEFLISVTTVGKEKYLVRTERVAAGVPLAEEQVNWPVEDWLEQARQQLNDPLWDLLEGTSTLQTDAINKIQKTPDLVALGQELYHNLLGGALRDSWKCAQSIAHHRFEVLHLRLGLKDRRLPQLPWEIMHRGDRPLATGTDVVFSRYQPSTSFLAPIRKVPADRPLKILMAIAAPSDRDSLEVEREYLSLKEEVSRSETDSSSAQGGLLGSGGEKRQIQLDILRQPDREQLTKALEGGQYQIFHYAGHSNWGPVGGQLYLVSGNTGLTETLSGEDLAGLLVNNGIQVAVFNSCRGAYSELLDSIDAEPAPNLAETIVNRGVPGVLAMAERIPDRVSIALTQLFYRNLAKGSASVTESLSRARQGLVSAYGSQQLYWALPVLYVHSEFDGYLLDDKKESEKLSQTKIDFVSLLEEWERQKKKALYSKLEMLPEAEEEEVFDATEEFEGDLELPVYKLGDRSEEDAAPIAEFFEKATNSEPRREPEPGGAIALNSSPKALLTISESRERTEDTSDRKTVKPRWRNLLKIGMPVIGTAIALGTMFSFNREPQPRDLLPSLPPEPAIVEKVEPVEERVDIDATPTGEVTAIAIELLSENDFSEAKLAVESLLDRGALPEAKAVLAVVPPGLGDDATILFLRGRLAWEFVQRGDDNYSIEDARRYWETAVRQNRDSLEYLNALGFALYAEGRLIQAYQVWEQVTDRFDYSSASPLGGGGETNLSFQSAATISPERSLEEIESLNAYAGIGLVLMKSAEDLSPEERGIRLSDAIKYRQKAISDGPMNFQPLALSRNWMWSENAIKDWQLLLSK